MSSVHCRVLLLIGSFLAVDIASAAMQVPGRFDVSPQGSATYTIPLIVPPGTVGMVPSIKLTYDSAAGNGLAGKGWSLSGLQSITRCPTSIAQDGGVGGGISFNSTDRFCLGGERLVSNGGAYGASGTEYRTERESFAKVVSYGSAGDGPAWFKVWTKAGQIMEFGNTGDSRIEAQGKSVARVWALNRIQDIKTNYLTVSYTEDAANGDFYPQRIDYTGNLNQSMMPNNSVQFQYEARPDIETSYRAGSLMRSAVRLQGVKTYAGTALVMDYQLSYETVEAGSASQLSSVRQCDGAGVCLPATSFGWTRPALAALVASGTWIETGGAPIANNQVRSVIALDLNGDGKTDLVQPVDQNGILWLVPMLSDGLEFKVGTAFNTNLSAAHMSSLIPVDMNGDGKRGLVYARHYTIENYLQYVPLMFDGAAFAVGPAVNSSTFDEGKTQPLPIIALDFDGDGRTDLVQPFDASGDVSLQVFRSNGTGFEPQALTLASSRRITDWYPTISVMAGDLNGDGKADLIETWHAPQGNMFVLPLISNGTGFSAGTWIDTGMPTYDSTKSDTNIVDQLLTMDVNGDGLTDLLFVDMELWSTGPRVIVVPFFSTGADFAKGSAFNITDGTFYLASTVAHELFVTDINGDGKMDLTMVLRDADTMLLLQHVISTGTGFDAHGWYNTGERWDTVKKWYEQSDGTAALGAVVPVGAFVDYDGDSKSDLVQLKYTEGSGVVSVLGHRSSSLMGGLLDSVNNGLGPAIDVGYKPLTDNSIYTKDAGTSGAVYPMADLQLGLYVVTSARSLSGNGGVRTMNYTYGGLKTDRARRAWAGFRWSQSRHAETGIITRTEMRQDWPYWGMVSLAQQKLDGAGNAGLLKQTVSEYTCNDFVTTSGCIAAPGRRYFVAPSHMVSSGWDLNGAALPSETTDMQYDMWGNPTRVMVTTGGYVDTTIYTYVNDTTNWFLGRVTNTTVTNSMP